MSNINLNARCKKNVLLRPKEEILVDSIQLPLDPDSFSRYKGDQKIKGYSANVIETVSDGLDLISRPLKSI